MDHRFEPGPEGICTCGRRRGHPLHRPPATRCTIVDGAWHHCQLPPGHEQPHTDGIHEWWDVTAVLYRSDL